MDGRPGVPLALGAGLLIWVGLFCAAGGTASHERLGCVLGGARWDVMAVWERYDKLLRVCDRGLEVRHARGLELDPEGHRVASMTNGLCPRYMLAGASVRDGIVVEFGTWAGASMRCMAGGLNLTGKPNRAHGFDTFKVGYVHTNTVKLVKQTNGTRWHDEVVRGGHGYNMLPLFLFYTESVYPSIRAHKINLGISAETQRDLFGRQRIDVFTTDSAKTWHGLRTQLKVVADYLQTGSLVILADFYYSKGQRGGQIPGVYRWLVQPGCFELVDAFASHAFFALRRPLDARRDLGSSDSKAGAALEQVALADLERTALVGDRAMPAAKLETVREVVRRSFRSRWW